MFPKKINQYQLKQLLLMIALVITSFGFGQGYDQDIQAIMEHVESAEELLIKVDAVVYSKKGGTKIYSTKSSMKHSIQGSITEMEGGEIYKSGDFEVHVDHSNKTVFVHKTQHYSEDDFSKKSLKEMRKYFEQEMEKPKAAKKEVISDENGIRKYRLTNIEGFEEMVAVLDVKNFKLIEIRYWYAKDGPQKGQYCVVKYDTFNYKPSFDKETFSESTYFLVENGNFKVSAKYKNYKIIKG